MQSKNSYLEQVINEQQRVQAELQAPALKRRANFVAAPQAQIAAAPNLAYAQAAAPGGAAPREPASALERALSVRITGVWPWQTVVVPPNVYVIHTRSGTPKPVHIGLGLSFRFNPFTDAFLLVPATIQTILINAAGICAERQGVLLQAYVQWIVDDIELAYRKLDFSDPEDPMRVVAVQLREQAEAAMKDKISTMRIDEVLTDKRSIIEELTARLREVAEGSKNGDSGGLGLKIVTVQIKEAVVSSTRVWENLQRPYRAEQEKVARLAELESERAVRVKEEAEAKEAEMSRLANEEELAQLRHQKDIERFTREQEEKRRRLQLDQELEQQRIAEATRTALIQREKAQEVSLREMELEAAGMAARLEQIRHQQAIAQAEAESEMTELRLRLEREKLLRDAEHEKLMQELERQERSTHIRNLISKERIEAELVQRLPEIAEKLPKPEKLRSVQINGEGMTGGLVGLIESLRGVIQSPGSTKVEE